jgi:hypothetical protein
MATNEREGSPGIDVSQHGHRHALHLGNLRNEPATHPTRSAYAYPNRTPGRSAFFQLVS